MMVQMTNAVDIQRDDIFSLDSIRHAAQHLMQYAEKDQLKHYQVDFSRLNELVETLVATKNPEELRPHTQWRNFDPDGAGRLEGLNQAISQSLTSSRDQVKALFDMLLLNEALETGGNGSWKFVDHKTGATLSRTEGLAVATLRSFERGFFSSIKGSPFQVDYDRLIHISDTELASAFQVESSNPMLGGIGLKRQRLQVFAQMLKENSEFFGFEAIRPGNLFDNTLQDRQVNITQIFSMLSPLLEGLWPGNRHLGVSVGDMWEHSLFQDNPQFCHGVPIHRICQWLHYALVPMLTNAGYDVDGVDKLTGLPGYRNTGLLVDFQVIVPKNKQLFTQQFSLGDEAIVELRCLTIGLLDRCHSKAQELPGFSQENFPMSKVNGLFWHEGRRLAATIRPDGAPPFAVKDQGVPF